MVEEFSQVAMYGLKHLKLQVALESLVLTVMRDIRKTEKLLLQTRHRKPEIEGLWVLVIYKNSAH